MRRWAWVVSAALLTTTAAFADEPDGREVARVRYAEGVRLYRSGSFGQALEAFVAAYDATKNWRVLYNIAQVQAQLRDYAASIQSFERYLHEGAELDAARVAEVKAEIERLEGLVATVEVSSETLGARVFVDDVPAGDAPLKMRVNIGSRTVRVSADGYLSASERVFLAPAETKKILLNLSLAPKASPQIIVRERPRAVTPQAWITLRWAFGISTVAFGAAAITSGAIAVGRNGVLDDALSVQPADPARIDTLRDQVRTASLVSDVALVASAVSLAGFIVALIGPFESRKNTIKLSPTLGGALLEVPLR